MTTPTRDQASDSSVEIQVAAGRCRAVTRSSGSHPADWGRAIALALEYLAVQVAYTVRQPESGILIGRDVRLQFETNGLGVEISAELDDDSHLGSGLAR